MELIANPNGNYTFLTGIAPYSAGVVAMAGHEIIHVTLRQPRPYRQGFELIQEYLTAIDRPRAALCAIELRSPAPFSFAGFIDFNNGYQALLEDWGLLLDGRNPIARTNIAPAVNAPEQPMLYGFSYTVPITESISPTFVVAGAGDLRDQADLSQDAIVRPGETSANALQEKAEVVIGVMAARLAGLEMSWDDVTTVEVYTTYPLQPILTTLLLPALGPATAHGIRWYYSHPPIAGLLFEMDLRGVRQEIYL